MLVTFCLWPQIFLEFTSQLPSAKELEIAQTCSDIKSRSNNIVISLPSVWPVLCTTTTATAAAVGSLNQSADITLQSKPENFRRKLNFPQKSIELEVFPILNCCCVCSDVTKSFVPRRCNIRTIILDAILYLKDQ